MLEATTDDAYNTQTSIALAQRLFEDEEQLSENILGGLMHIPKKFYQEDPTQLQKIIRDHPFATLICHSESGLEADHLPLYLDLSHQKQQLHGHIAKANPLWKNLDEGSTVLAVFNGPDCYISPNHYPTKNETGKAVPTWNYVVVHARGEISFIHDEEWNLRMINKLTHQHESPRSQPWSLKDAPESYSKKMLTAIVGVKIEISSIVGQWKVSQNQPEKNRRGVIAGLKEEGGHKALEIAELIQTDDLS